MIRHLGLPKVKDAVVRGEFIFPKALFEEKYAAKYANARNLVSGVINAKKGADTSKYKDLDFVAYEVPTSTSFWTISHAFLSSASPHTCRVLRSTWCPC